MWWNPEVFYSTILGCVPTQIHIIPLLIETMHLDRCASKRQRLDISLTSFSQMFDINSWFFSSYVNEREHVEDIRYYGHLKGKPYHINNLH